MLVKIQDIVIDLEKVLFARIVTPKMVAIRFSHLKEDVMLSCSDAEDMLAKLVVYSRNV
jgi:hypothetical protein